jgi:hypothetical protein
MRAGGVRACASAAATTLAALGGALAVSRASAASPGEEAEFRAWARPPAQHDSAVDAVPAVDGELGDRARSGARGGRLTWALEPSGSFWAARGRMASADEDGPNPQRILLFGFGDTPAADRVRLDDSFLRVRFEDSRALRMDLVAGALDEPLRADVEPEGLVFARNVDLDGALVRSALYPREGTKITGTFGAFLLRDGAPKRTPKLFAGQLGFDTWLTDSLDLGVRASGYQYRSIDGGSSRGSDSSREDRARMGELFAYASFEGSDQWPVLLYGRALMNFGADSGDSGERSSSQSDSAYAVGLEAGSASKLLKLGVGYFRVEPRAMPLGLADRDFRSDFMNREGLRVTASRKFGASAELTLALFATETVRRDFGDFDLFPAADRKAQIGLRFSFY